MDEQKVLLRLEEVMMEKLPAYVHGLAGKVVLTAVREKVLPEFAKIIVEVYNKGIDKGKEAKK